jgi:hypothetical protein
MPHFSQQNTQIQTMKVVPEQALSSQYLSNSCRHDRISLANLVIIFLPLMPKLGLINKCYIFFGICYLICWHDRIFIIILDKLSELILPLSEG